MYDLKASDFSVQREMTVATGQTVTNEGLLLVSVIEAGVERVQMSAGSGTEVFVGFSIRDNASNNTMPVVESAFVPASAPFTVNTNSVNLTALTSVRVHDVTAAADLTVVSTTPNAGEAQVDLLSGLLTFNSAEASHEIVVYYRYNLTVEEATRLFGQRSVNNAAAAEFGQVTVGGGHGRILTSEYDPSKSYASSGGVPVPVHTGPNGLLTTVTTGPLVGHVTSEPSVSSPLLGVRFNTNLG